MARRPTFRSCSVALRNANTPAANNHDNAKQTPEMTPDRCNQESQLQDDEHEANPLLKTASSSAPPSPSFVTDQKCELIKQSSYDLEYMEYEEDGLLKSSAILENIREIGEGNTPGITCSLELDKLQDGRNCYNNNTEASFYGNGYSADCGELPNLRDLQIYNTALCLTQSDTSVSSSLDNYTYCYGNQMEYTCDVGGCCRDDYRPYRAATPPKVLPHAPCLTRQHPVDEFLTMDKLQVPHDSRQFNLVSSSSSSDSLNNEGDYLDSSSDEMYPLYNKESISEKLNEMCDDLFDDMLLDNRASIADLNEFDNLVLSLPTIPEGSIEYTDSDLETKGLNECDSISSSHWNNAFDQCDGNADESNIDNRKPDIVSSVKTPPGGGGDNQAFIVESESVDDDEEGCVGINNRTGTDERTLLLSSFEGMESTLV
ncbi:uncharacterized protein LOC141908876 [Tubulanus polymorphus]|uniref:uncharacterized protein LOC141908876 n=1 Tax=Tubulanus polymorphus TaxID=672921 RepID=UPI003DA2743F